MELPSFPNTASPHEYEPRTSTPEVRATYLMAHQDKDRKGKPRASTGMLYTFFRIPAFLVASCPSLLLEMAYVQYAD